MDDVWMGFIKITGRDKLNLNSLHGVKHSIFEEFLPHIVPVVFLGIKLRAIGRQGNDPHMLREG